MPFRFQGIEHRVPSVALRELRERLLAAGSARQGEVAPEPQPEIGGQEAAAAGGLPEPVGAVDIEPAPVEPPGPDPAA